MDDMITIYEQSLDANLIDEDCGELLSFDLQSILQELTAEELHNCCDYD